MTDTAFYTNLQNMADRLLESKGQSATLTATTQGTYNIGTGATGNTTTNYTVTLAALDIVKKNVEGSVIQEGDQMALMSAKDLSAEPKVNDVLTVDSIKYSIKKANPINPGGTVVVYQLWIRK